MKKAEAQKLLRNQANSLWSAFSGLTVEELKQLREIVNGWSTTNCWHIEYALKGAILILIDDRLLVEQQFSTNNKPG